MANTSENKRFSTKSNVRRAARQDGLDLDQIEIMQDGAQFYYVITTTKDNEGETGMSDTTIPSGWDVIDTTSDQNHDQDTGSTADLQLLDAEGESYGPVNATDAEASAVALANSTGGPIKVMDMTTGNIILTAEPAAVESEATEGTTTEDVTEGGSTEGTSEGDQGGAEGDGSEVGANEAVLVVVHATAGSAGNLAAQIAKLLKVQVDIANPDTMEILHSVEHKATVVRTPRTTGEPVKARKEAPDGKKAEVIRLCCRETGASPAELIKATGWTKAPWKWMLSSDPKNNLCDKYGYDYAESRDGRNVRYLLAKREDAAQEQAA